MKSKIVFNSRSFPARAERVRAEGADRGEWFYYKKTITFEALPEKAELFTLGAGYFEVYINGVFCCEYSVRSYIYNRAYECYNIAELLKKGENIICVYMCDDGNRNGGFYCEIISDESFTSTKWKYARDSALISKTTYFLELNSPEIFDFGKINVADKEHNWKEATCTLDMPYERIYQAKQLPQTKERIKCEQLTAVLGVQNEKKFDFSFESPSGCCSAFYCTLSASRTLNIEILTSGGVFEFYIDGKKTEQKTQREIILGEHFVLVISLGGTADFSIKYDGDIALSEWRRLSCEMPKSGMKYPWNEPRQAPVLPEVIKFIASVKSINGLPREISDKAIEIKSAPIPLWHNIFTQRYFLPRDFVCGDKYLRQILKINDDEISSAFITGKNVFLPSGKGKTALIFDMGKETVGRICFSVDARAGAEITFFAFEMITKSGIRQIGARNAGKIICKEGKNAFVSHGRRGFRYICLCVERKFGDVDITDVGSDEERYPVTADAAFECDDEMINGIYKISADTARVCMLDSYVDCPGFEQNTWVGDAGITAGVNMTNFGAGEYDRRYLYTIGRSMDDAMGRTYRKGNERYAEPTFLPCACFTTYPEGGIPIWSFTWAFQMIEHYMYFGADEGFEQGVNDLKECLKRCKAHINNRGLFEIDGAWNLIEWAENDLTPVGEVSANNMMLAGLFERSAEFFDMTDETAAADECKHTAVEIKKAINRYCWDDEKHAYIDTVRDEYSYDRYIDFCKKKNRRPYSYEEYKALSRVSVQTATFALLYDVAQGERNEACRKILLEGVSTGQYTASTPANVLPDKSHRTVGVGSPFFLYYVLKTLFKLGEYDVAINVIRRDWGGMLHDGLKTCVETFKDKNGEWGRSAAHAWSASPAIFCITEFLGIKPTKPAFEEFAVEPHPCGLSFAAGTVPTPHGDISVKWRKEKGKLQIDVKAPKECKRI